MMIGGIWYYWYTSSNTLCLCGSTQWSGRTEGSLIDDFVTYRRDDQIDNDENANATANARNGERSELLRKILVLASILVPT